PSTMPTPASPEPGRYRGALIGAGGIARQSHLPALRSAPLRGRVDVVAVVDTALAVPPVDGIPLLRDRAALSDLAPLDFIDICTPTASHLELIVWGLEQGYHVVCEKPVALTRAEAARIAAAARASGRIVMPCHQYRYNPVWLRVKEWLAAGAIGRWHLAEFSVHRLAADPGRAGWRRGSSPGPDAPARTASASSGMPARSNGWTESCDSSAGASSSDWTSRPSSTRRRITGGSPVCSRRSSPRSTRGTPARDSWT